MKEDDDVKLLVYIFFIIAYALVTFFGLGPVIFADGSDKERIITLIIVLAVYVLLTVLLRLIVKRISK
ncbi:DUF6954 family protein [Paenibacillus sp. sgz500958]|uniref:DUF6954 family protein n=1 Tax=Paenibacillus sp. sgz500958 TaxID=3242475 RepID=UPI0036D2932B